VPLTSSFGVTAGYINITPRIIKIIKFDSYIIPISYIYIYISRHDQWLPLVSRTGYYADGCKWHWGYYAILWLSVKTLWLGFKDFSFLHALTHTLVKRQQIRIYTTWAMYPFLHPLLNKALGARVIFSLCSSCSNIKYFYATCGDTCQNNLLTGIRTTAYNLFPLGHYFSVWNKKLLFLLPRSDLNRRHKPVHEIFQA